MPRRNWVRSMFARRPSTIRKADAKNRSRITFDTLEDRTVPAVIDVTGFGTTAFPAPGTGTSADGNVVLTHITSDQASGSGILNPFLRVDHKTSEQGYNTSFRAQGNDPELLDDITNLTFTHDMKLAD